MQLTTQIKSQAIAYGLKSITGYDPVISERPDGTALIAFNAADLSYIRSNIEKLALRAGQGQGQGDVSIAFQPVLVPLALKYMLPVIIGVLALGACAGYFAGKGKIPFLR